MRFPAGAYVIGCSGLRRRSASSAEQVAPAEQAAGDGGYALDAVVTLGVRLVSVLNDDTMHVGAVTLAVLTLVLAQSRGYPGFTAAFLIIAAAAAAGAVLISLQRRPHPSDAANPRSDGAAR
jgi:hypothetical protein